MGTLGGSMKHDDEDQWLHYQSLVLTAVVLVEPVAVDGGVGPLFCCLGML
jgi:hypothetical protein